jgi:predicted O-linked N-acetylglucosamine transferase (SPINDLY family)
VTIDTTGLSELPFQALVAKAETIGSGQGRSDVIELYGAWIEAQPKGARDLHVAWFNLGTELGNSGETVAAIAAYRNALGLVPGFHPAAINLGLLLERLGHTDTAIAIWTDAIQSDDARTGLLNQRGRLLEQAGNLAEAEETMRRSLLTRPEQPDVVQHWLHVRQKMCQWPVMAETVPGLSAQDMLAQSGPLSALALTDDVTSQGAIGAGWIGRKTQPAPRLAPEHGYRHDRIRIGYLSSDFCSHAMSYLIAELFERHDRNKFEIFGYCNSPEDGSPIRARVIAAFDHFVTIRALSDEAAARRIREDEIDILIDLNGLTSGGRLQVIRWKPAPIQATYLGFIGPVPLPELDYLLCDDFVVPPANASAYRPVPLPIQGLYQANDSKRVMGSSMSRAEAGLPDDRFVFCCFSNHYKITEAMFAAWINILRQTGDSVLWLVDDNKWSRQNLRLRALISGVNPQRLIFAPRVDPARYMARLALGDLFLDTFPYNAGTIASDVIRMGLPMISLAGQSFASRMAARMLHAIGADDGIADNYAEYTETAVALATDPVLYRAYRARFNEQAWAASIGDIAGFTKRFEATLESIRLTPVKLEPALPA